MPWKYFLHGTICRYSCAFLSLCKFQTGNPSRRFASHRFAAMRYVFSHLGTLVESSHGAASPMRYSRGRYSLSEVWNLLIHKRTANRIFSTTFSIFFFYQKYIHTHIFSQTGVDLYPTRFLILIPTMSKRIVRSAQILVRWLVSANYGTSHDL